MIKFKCDCFQVELIVMVIFYKQSSRNSNFWFPIKWDTEFWFTSSKWSTFCGGNPVFQICRTPNFPFLSFLCSQKISIQNESIITKKIVFLGWYVPGSPWTELTSCIETFLPRNSWQSSWREALKSFKSNTFFFINTTHPLIFFLLFWSFFPLKASRIWCDIIFKEIKQWKCSFYRQENPFLFLAVNRICCCVRN